jgi:VCBS repeat-containing protein
MFTRKKKKTSVGEGLKAQGAPTASKLKNSLLNLEQRLMFDAAAAATAAEVQSEQVAQDQAEAAVSADPATDSKATEQSGSQDLLHAITTYNPGESKTEVAFVDPTVPDYETLVAGMGPNVEVIMLDATRDGIEQIAESLAGRTGIDAIHLISHGSSGELQLGTGTLTADSMSAEYAGELATIREALSDQADFLVYGCDFAEGQTGLDAVQRLADLTGADVQASTDETGNISLGGDWEFEVQTGAIETLLAVGYDTQMNWAGILGTETVKDTFSTTSYGNNNGTQSWSTSWSETDAGGSGASGGDVRVNSGQLRIDTDTVGNAASRGVNLSGTTSATLTLSYNNTLTGADRIEARVSNDGGATYTTLAGGVFSSALKTGSGSASFDISAYASANTRIQFIVTGTGGGDRLYVDNVQVTYSSNSAPVISSNGGGATANVTVAENSTVVTTVAATDADVGQTRSYSIVGGADAAKFTINSMTGALSFASIPNYESPTDSGGNNVYDVTVQASDGHGGTATQAIAVTLTNVNEGPTGLTLTGSTVAENATNGTVVGTVSGTDPDAGDTKSYSLTDTAGGRFAINSSTGQITVLDSSLLNYEAATNHNVTVRVTDSGGLTYDEMFTINLTNVNETPTGADATITITEDTSHTLTTANFGFSDVDAGDSLSAVRIDTLPGAGSLTLSGGAVTAGQVVTVADITAGNLVFTPAANAIGTGYANFTYSVRDSNTAYDAAPNTVTFNMTAVNDTPTDLALSANTVAENATNGAVVGTVTGTDVDAGDTKSYSLTDTAGGRFAINSSTGQITVADGSLLNYEAQASHSVTVRVTDAGGLTYGEMFTINLTNVNEAPTGADVTVTINEDTSHTLTTANFGFSDVDAADTMSAVRIDSLPTAGFLTLSGVAMTAGQVVTVANITAGNLVFTPVADANGTGYAGFTFSVRDSNNAYDAAPNTVTFNVTPVNDAPILSTNEGATVTEGSTIVLSAKSLEVTDIDNGSGELVYTLTSLPANGMITLKGVALGEKDTFTQADINSGILEYVHDGSETDSDSLTFVVQDGAGGAISESILKIAVTSSNEAPILNANEGATVNEAGSIVLSIKNLEVVDVDNSPSDLRYMLTSLPAHGTFFLKGTPLSLKDAFTQEDINNEILEYVHDGSETTSDSLTFIVDDGAGGTLEESTFKIEVTPINDAPTDLALSANIVAENATNGTVVGTVSGTDPDTSDTKTYTLTDTAGGRFAVNSSTGQLTVANGSLLNYEAATSHTVAVRVTDSGGLTHDQTFTINLTNVNEAPTGADATVTLTEDTSHTLTTANFGFSDVDAGDSLSEVRIETLPGAGSLTLSGVAVMAGQVVTVSDITAGNLVFTPTTDGAGTNYATFTFSIRDSSNLYDAAPNTVTFNVTSVNDAPIRTAGTVSNLTLSEDAPLASLGLGGVAYSAAGGADESGQTLTYAVTAIPSPSIGDVFLADGTTRVTVGPYSLADIQGMQFKSAANASGVTAFQFDVSDSGGTANGGADNISQFILITVNAVNDAPTITNLSGDSLVYSEGDGAVAIEQSADALVADVDSTNFNAGTLTVSIPTGGDSAEDVLSIRIQGTGVGQIGVSGSTLTYGSITIGTFTGGSSGSDLVITLNSSATPTAVTALIKNITYENTDTNAPTTGARTVRYVLTDGDGGTSANYDTTVMVTAVNDAPTDLVLSANTVAENAANGTVVGIITGTDPDSGDTKTYSLTDAAGGRFAINSATGQLTVANGSLLNYESATSHTVTVRVTDSGGLTHDQTFTINLTNVNEGPTLAINTGSTVVEGGTGTITASELAVTDVDTNDAQLSYTIGTGPAHGQLELTTTPGVAATTFTQADIAVNRVVYVHDGSETTSDQFTFTVSDGAGGSVGSTAVTLTITPINDNPTIASGGGGTHAACSLAENISAVTVVCGVDVDLPADVLTYSISGGADQARFTIDAGTGALAFTAPPDFEVATDTNGDNIYVVQVRVTDSQSATATQTIQVTVTNLAETVSAASSVLTIPPVLLQSAPVPVAGEPRLKPAAQEPEKVAAPSSGITSPAKASDFVVPSFTLANGEMPPPPVFKPDELRRIDVPVKDQLLPHWNEEGGPPAFTVLPVEIADQVDSQEPDLPEKVSEILMAKLDAMATSLEEAVSLDQEQEVMVVRVAAVGGTTLSVGFVAWALRSSVLLASCLSTLPAWKSFDPLPVVRLSRQERNRRRQATDVSQRQEQDEFDGLQNFFSSDLPLKDKP